MSDLSSFIASRRQELQDRHDELVRELAPIRAELQELARAEHALYPNAGSKRGRPSGVREGSIQSMALAVLETAPSGARADEIRNQIAVQFGRDLERESVAPQLSRLCQSGKVENRAGTYHLAARSTPSTDGTTREGTDGRP